MIAFEEYAKLMLRMLFSKAKKSKENNEQTRFPMSNTHI